MYRKKQRMSRGVEREEERVRGASPSKYLMLTVF